MMMCKYRSLRSVQRTCAVALGAVLTVSCAGPRRTRKVTGWKPIPLAVWPPAPPLEAAVENDAGPLPPSITAEPRGRNPSLALRTRTAGRWRCTFRFRPDAAARTVALAGTFNGWNRDANVMSGPDESGAWSTRVTLAAGVHQYKFVVNGETWLADPRNTDKIDDHHGAYNSVVRLGLLARLQASSARVGDGRIEINGLEHRADMPLYFQSLGDGRVLLRYRTFAHDVERVTVALRGDSQTDMHAVRQGPLFALYEAVVAAAGSFEYTFVLTDGARRASDPRRYTHEVSHDKVFRTPDWAANAVWYQIMPDRFRNGDASNDPDPVRAWTSDWFTPSADEAATGESFYKYYVFHRFYGGDIAGLEWALPYLRDLGVNALYLNPIFKADTNHKYNATSYLHVDDHFGDEGDYERVAAQEDLLKPDTWQWTASDRRFLKFLDTAHKSGMRVIIDGVFNHVGTAHPAFQDILKNGAKSKYADWFDVTSWKPFKYRGWAGFDQLPVFRKSTAGLASPTLVRHIFAVTRRWMDPNGDGDPSDGIDGWRLDVPNEIARPFWAEWRTLVKSINPRAYISGEIWDRADAWLDGRHFDAVMNYEFARAAVAWICDRRRGIKPSEIDRRLSELRLAYPLAATRVMQNLLDSHDTDRIASMARNPDRGYDQRNRIQDNGPEYDSTKPNAEEYARVRLMALLQMTYVGAPMIYYGDEVGMWGADDPTNRKPMLWKDLEPYEKPRENFVMSEQLDFYRRAIALRNAHPALRSGSFQTLLTDDDADVWAFLRRDQNERLIVVLNASATARKVTVPSPTGPPATWRIVFGQGGPVRSSADSLDLRVPALAGVVLQASN